MAIGVIRFTDKGLQTLLNLLKTTLLFYETLFMNDVCKIYCLLWNLLKPASQRKYLLGLSLFI